MSAFLDSGDSPIAALATAAGPAGVCVVRLSGHGALTIADRLVPHAVRKPSEREGGTFFHARIVHPATGEVIDDAVVLVFRGPNSFTGEDVVEIQGHGGSTPARRLLDATVAAGARVAEAGEFSKRAFLNGRMDLTQAEALCEFIHSKTERAASVARAQLDGALGTRVVRNYEALTLVCADVEHLLDFDEGELPDTFAAECLQRVGLVRADLTTLVESWREGHLLRDGALVVISGKPNAGKSSLLNALLGRDRAIVHEAPGTTRDVIEESLSVAGIPLRLADTAGLRATADVVESAGIARTRALMRQADVQVHVVDAAAGVLDAEALAELDPRRSVIGLTKCDLPSARELEVPGAFTRVRLSAVTGAGLEELRAAIVAKLGLEHEGASQVVVSQRQADELRQAVCRLCEAEEALSGGSALLVVAANALRQASEGLGRIVGRVYSDDLLEAVFSRFCVGK